MQISCLMWRATVFKSVLSLKLKIFARKSTTLEKLANGRYVFEVQPTGTMVVDSLSERIQSIRVSVDFFADFHGKCQSDDEAKYNICSVFNDTSHFQCLVTAHKLKFWIYVTATIGHSRVQPSLLGYDRLFFFWAQRKPNAKLEVYKVFQDRLTFLNRHMIV